MIEYSITVNAYKRSGKYYTGERHFLGYFENYPIDEIYNFLEKLRNNMDDLDKAAGLRLGSIVDNDFIVMYIVVDSTKDPICMSGILKA